MQFYIKSQLENCWDEEQSDAQGHLTSHPLPDVFIKEIQLFSTLKK